MNCNSLTAIWDFSKADNRLGSFIIFQEELLQFCLFNHISMINLYFESMDLKQSMAVWTTLAQLNPAINSITFSSNKLPSHEGLNEERLIWPVEDLIQESSYYGSTLAVQKLWKQTGRMINLLSPDSEIQRAKNWLGLYLDKEIPVVVHLKVNPLDPQSNANQEAWAAFFDDCLQKKIPVKFILIGSDQIENYIKELHNIIISKEYGGDISLDFALVQQSVAFMGMSSGPCNLAIMSSNPYLIWKHPNHHSDKMEKEFQGMNGFIFSTEHQKFFREFDTFDHISTQFHKLYADHLSEWKQWI
ncbi:MAG: hypothetical protein HQ510_06460 [Candidatus Marinimicrobia bacterium]|nr:hypothetical protein [Candidatus Neomarinimicrobiota bacterium]